jgi:IS30 family transposase
MLGDGVVPHGVKVPEEELQRAILLLRMGASNRQTARAVGCSSPVIDRLVRTLGGVCRAQVGRSKRNLSFEERETIMRGLVAEKSLAAIARELGRATSTVSREVNANGGREGYRAGAADQRATERACRARPTKLQANPELAAVVSVLLDELFWSPQQIAWFLREWYVDRPEMWVSHETIYQALFVQGRGELRKELTACLRTGRARRRPHGKTDDRGKIPNMVLISERPAEVEDRAVPGHWEGDLMTGAFNRSAIGTLVERTTRFTMLLWLPDGHGADQVSAAMQAKILQLPDHLRRSLTWDQGSEMARHAEFTIATGLPVYFCDPRSPWQRGTNENTNGLLRQWFPKGTDLSVHSEADLDEVAAKLNGRPRQTLNWLTPSQALDALVATTA